MRGAGRNAGFKATLPVTEEEVWAVGMVILQWSALETLFDMLLHHANGGRQEIPRSLRGRCELFGRLVEAEVASLPSRLYLSEVRLRLLDLAEQRDRVAHHNFSETDGKVTLFDWRRPRKPMEERVSFERLKTLAMSIEELRLGLFDFVLREGRVKLDEPMFAVGWPRICGRS